MGPGVTWLGCTSWCWPHWGQNWQDWISARTPGRLVQRDLSAWDRLEEFVFVSKASSFAKPLCQSKHAAVLKAGGCGRDRELWIKLGEKMEKNIGRKLGRHHLAWMHVLESVFQQKSFLGTVQALTRTDWAPRAIFSDAHGQEGSPAWVHKGKEKPPQNISLHRDSTAVLTSSWGWCLELQRGNGLVRLDPIPKPRPHREPCAILFPWDTAPAPGDGM